ncbi:hypothetical protein GTA08_BOTSDO11343 [Neofusicoccum parvum]|nr:hypothetical protein GTA08_BOTSDO11343 [Neofusicoccum parvum]
MAPTSPIRSSFQSLRKYHPEISSNTVVVYDSLNQIYWKDTAAKYEGSDAGEFVDIGTGKKNTKVDIYVNVGGTQMFLATIDLKKLGFDIKSRRKAGKLDNIYVLGQSPNGR